MKRLTDTERVASLREALEAANGDWHEATRLQSVCADLNWLLASEATASPGDERLREAVLRYHREWLAFANGETDDIERQTEARDAMFAAAKPEGERG